jgi:hypothetical protein
MSLYLTQNIAILIIAYSSSVECFSQGPPFSERKIKKGIKNAQCVHTNKFSINERQNFYPFKNASTIKLVSFAQPEGEIVTLPTVGGKVDYSGLKEIKDLTRNQITSLTDILFNNTYRGGNFIFGPAEAECYLPRNAILFTDSTNTTYAFIELCFQCERHRSSSDEVQTGDFCDGKYSLLKDFFVDCGIKAGVTENK